MEKRVLVTTGNEFDGYRVGEYLGVVRGVVVRAPGIGQGLRGSLASIFGGNIRAYEEVCETARAHAFGRMVEHAVQLGADGLIGVRYDATEFSEGISEVLAYGTAVRLTRNPQ